MAKIFSKSYNRLEIDYIKRHYSDESRDLLCTPCIPRRHQIKFAVKAGVTALSTEIALSSIV
ncbi:MAG: hypothetical protein HDS24_05675 [Bacteroides sp.]|nr:hypothetical protein [Bacteroides sp.]